jgi:hypothetical protein
MINPYSPVTRQYKPVNQNITNQPPQQLNSNQETSLHKATISYGIPLAMTTVFSVGLGLAMKVSKPLILLGALVLGPLGIAVGSYCKNNN